MTGKRLLIAIPVAMLLSATRPAAAQEPVAGLPELSAEETELFELARGLGRSCDSEELSQATGSSFTAELGERTIRGNAVFGTERDGDLIVMLGLYEGDDADCLVWVSRSGPPALGVFPVVALSPALMSGELKGRHFAGGYFTRSEGTSAILIPESGSLEFLSLENGTLEGQFTLEGWTVTQGQSTKGHERVSGEFRATDVNAPGVY